MTIQAKLLCAIAVSGFAALVASAPAQALTSQECSAKYQAAKKDGTLGRRSGMTSARPSAARMRRRRRADRGCPAAPAARAEPKAAAKKEAAPAAAPAPTMPMGNAVFPNAVDPKYAKESAGKARLHTCVDQYNANKTTNGNGGMKWIEKGGGYYSECNKKLKGAA